MRLDQLKTNISQRANIHRLCLAFSSLSLVLIDETVIKDKGLAENSEGLLILSVEADSEAANKGLLEGDIISEAGQQKVTSVADLTDRIDEAKEAGRKSLLLLVRRGTDPRFVALSLQ